MPSTSSHSVDGLDVAQISRLGTWRFDYASSRLFWSKGVHEIFGTEPEQFDGRPQSFLDCVHPDDRERVAAEIARAESNKSPFEVEFRIIRQDDGQQRHVVEHGEIEFNDEGIAIENAGVIIDVTERRENELQVRQSLTLHRLAGRLARIGAWHVDLASNRIFWSEVVCAIHDLPAGTVPSLDEALAHFVDEHRESIMELMTACAQQGVPFDLEAQLLTATDRRIWVRVIGEAVREPDGGISAMRGVLQDLSEQKRSEHEIRRHRRRFVELAESMPVVVWTARTDGQIDFVNTMLSVYAGRDDLAFPGTGWMEIIHPDDMERCIDAWTRAAKSGDGYDLEFRLRRRDGVYRWHKVSAAPVREEDTENGADAASYKWYGAAIDIDDRISLEAEQRRLARRLTMTLESITDAFYTVDHEWRVTYVNAEAERLLRRRRDELIGQNLWEKFPEAHQTELYSKYVEALTSGQKAELEFYYDPLEKWFSVNAYPSDSGLAVYFQDISDRRTHESQLRLLETAMSRLSDVVIITETGLLDEPGPRITYVNDALARTTGYASEEVLGRSPRILQGPETQRLELDRIRSALEERHPVRAELLNYRKDGSSFWVELDIVPMAAEGEEFTHFVAVQRDITDRKQREEGLTLSEERFRTVAQITSDAIWDWDLTGGEIWTSESFASIFGHSPDSVPTVQAWMELVHPDERDLLENELFDCIAGATDTWSAQYRFRRADGRYANVMDRGVVIRDANGAATRILGGMSDLTEKEVLQERLQQVQRLEAIGQLTGGVAHDFNNLLTVILGNAEALSDDLAEDPYLGSLANVTLSAAQRGAELTQRLLAFSRQQALEPANIDANRVVSEMMDLLERTIRENIEISFKPAADLWSAFADPGQLENVVLNLVLNARDAIAEEGKITIETGNAELDGQYAENNPDVAAGYYVMLAVSDTGVGMTADVLERVFEPFFTTKEFGAGNGLGMSMVFGYAKQSNGHIKIYSEPGMGTTVRLYLPTGEGLDLAEAKDSLSDEFRGRGERILVVEDDKLVQDYVRGQLERLGYVVRTSDNGEEALEWLKSNDRPDLLFTDVIMPGPLNGKQLADEAGRMLPGLRVLFTSGYTENAIVHHGRLDSGVNLLNKPYSRRELALKVRAVLDAE